MVEQVDVLFWLAVFPLVLFAFAAILVGNVTEPAVRSGRSEARPQTSLIMAGLILVTIATLTTLLGRPVAAVAEVRPFSERIAVFGVSELPLGLLLLGLGGFLFAAYVGAHFGEGKWGRFLAKASQESAAYWSVLGIAAVLVQRDVLPPDGPGAAALWIVISVLTITIAYGTLARPLSRMD